MITEGKWIEVKAELITTAKDGTQSIVSLTEDEQNQIRTKFLRMLWEGLFFGKPIKTLTPLYSLLAQ